MTALTKTFKIGQRVQTPAGKATVLETEGYNGLILVRHSNGCTWLYETSELR